MQLERSKDPPAYRRKLGREVDTAFFTVFFMKFWGPRVRYLRKNHCFSIFHFLKKCQKSCVPNQIPGVETRKIKCPKNHVFWQFSWKSELFCRLLKGKSLNSHFGFIKLRPLQPVKTTNRVLKMIRKWFFALVWGSEIFKKTIFFCYARRKSLWILLVSFDENAELSPCKCYLKTKILLLSIRKSLCNFVFNFHRNMEISPHTRHLNTLDIYKIGRPPWRLALGYCVRLILRLAHTSTTSRK